MTRYYFNIFNRIGSAIDDEGQEFPDLWAARKQAIDSVRSILSSEAMEGQLDLCGRIEVTDVSRDILAVVPFIDAFDLYLPELE